MEFDFDSFFQIGNIWDTGVSVIGGAVRIILWPFYILLLVFGPLFGLTY